MSERCRQATKCTNVYRISDRCPYLLSHSMKLTSKALVFFFRFFAKVAAAASIFSLALVVSLSCPLLAWWRFSLDADIFAETLVFLFAPDVPSTSSTPTVLALPVRFPPSLSPNPTLPAERMRMPSESRTTIASAVVVSRVSYVKRVSASVSPDACAARE